MFANNAHFQTKKYSRFGHPASKDPFCIQGELRVENPAQIRLTVPIGPVRLDFSEYTLTLAQNGAAQPPRALLSIVECVR